MKKGFTLLELVVVILIIGVLATLGLTQYGRVIERSRGAEARSILGSLRTLAAAQWMETGDAALITEDYLGIGIADDEIPSGCRTSHYFSYALTIYDLNNIGITATRCGALGKLPPGGPAEGRFLTLNANLQTGDATFDTDGGY